MSYKIHSIDGGEVVIESEATKFKFTVTLCSSDGSPFDVYITDEDEVKDKLHKYIGDEIEVDLWMGDDTESNIMDWWAENAIEYFYKETEGGEYVARRSTEENKWSKPFDSLDELASEMVAVEGKPVSFEEE